MDLKTVKSYDNGWWLKHLELTTVYDTELIKEQWDWLIEQAERVEQLERDLEEMTEDRNTWRSNSLDWEGEEEEEDGFNFDR